MPKTKTGRQLRAVEVGQVWRETKTGRQLRVMSTDASFAICVYRFGTTGRFTAITEDVSVAALLSRRFTRVR